MCYSSSGAKYDFEQRYQSMGMQCKELIEANNQLQRTIKDADLRTQQLELNKSQVEQKTLRLFVFLFFRLLLFYLVNE
jgi:hypothetical protein